jgi:PEP-CTERM motif
MRRALLFVAAMFFVTCTSAFADGGSVNYSGNVNFLTAPGFTFSFTEPATLTSLDTTTTLNITQGATNLVLKNSEVQFFDSGDLGLFDLDFTYAGTFFDVQLFGKQIYTASGGSFNLLTGTFPVTGGFIFLNDNPFPVDLVTGGKVTAAGVQAPEPGSLLMLGLGIVALFAFRKKQFGIATA